MLCIIYSKEEMPVPEYTKRALTNYYNKNYFTNDEFRQKRIDNSRNNYTNNKEIIKMKARYKYWNEKGDLEKYQKKYPDDLAKLLEIGYIQ